MSDVTMLDMTGIVALESIADNFRKKDIALIINDLSPSLIKKLKKVGMTETLPHLQFTQSLDTAIENARDLSE